MSMVVWVILSICYFSMYLHDQVVICSGGKDVISIMCKRGNDKADMELEKEVQEYLDKKLLICQVECVSVKKNVLLVEADIRFSACVTLPFAEKLLGKSREIHLEQETIIPSCYMWDSDVVKKAVK